MRYLLNTPKISITIILTLTVRESPKKSTILCVGIKLYRTDKKNSVDSTRFYSGGRKMFLTKIFASRILVNV
eukprot:TRINITY_DN5990_c0_g1_i10.p1 TRINITY_DN5990_c0_g1~~TRINITY_DN5990_c0_g1_i10.p1  ORF type:complete len:72 (+),score=5.15 TRINITY_DN5990_c0_g1_i10:260-475(+)